MKIPNIHILSIILLALVCSCSSSSNGDDDTPPPTDNTDDVDPVPEPSAASLVFPEDNTECNTGEIQNEALSNVTFEWNAGQNTDSYEVVVTNLNAGGSVRATVTTTEATLSIARGAPFEWSVTSRADGTNETATSQTWRFYNEGPGIENYAPFPAEAITPTRGANLDAATTVVSFEWNASDVDDDIVGYEVFLDTSENPTASIGTTTESNLPDIAVASGNTYYWRVLTTDSANNTSSSEVFEFKVL